MIIKGVEEGRPFACIDRETLQDNRLSLKAKGLLAYFLSLPGDWQIHMREVMKHSTDGKRRHYLAMQELLKLGYAKRIQKRGSEDRKSSFAGCDYEIYMRPSAVGNTSVGCHTMGCHRQDTTNKTRTKKTDHTPRATARGDREASPCMGYSGKPTSRTAKLVDKFCEFTIRKRTYLGKKGSTQTGWSARTLRHWHRAMRDFVQQHGELGEIERVMSWYLEHHEDDYIPVCTTVQAFVEKFDSIQRAMKRSSNGHTRKQEYERDEPYTPIMKNGKIYRRED